MQKRAPPTRRSALRIKLASLAARRGRLALKKPYRMVTYELMQDPQRLFVHPLVTRVRFDGTTSDMAWIMLRNIVLNILALGFYRFAGRVRMRRYIWDHVCVG